MEQKNFNNKKLLIGLSIIAIAVMLYLVVFLVFPKKLEAPTSKTPTQANTFRGPTGVPFVKGPTAPPPGN